jgi:hypothetical protein
MAILDHINIDLDGDGEKERYELRDANASNEMVKLKQYLILSLAEINEKLTWKFFGETTGALSIDFPEDFNEIYGFTQIKSPTLGSMGSSYLYFNKSMLDQFDYDSTNIKTGGGISSNNLDGGADMYHNYGFSYIIWKKAKSISLDYAVAHNKDYTDNARTCFYYR